MPPSLKRAALAAALACVVLASATAAAQAPPAGPLIPEGPSGRTPLTSWTLAHDPANRGLARGWQRGGFAGASVSVPNVVDPLHIKGRSGTHNYEGSVAWYRTSFQAPAAGTYAFSFSSANFQATAYVDGRAIVSHRGSYLPFEGRATLSAGAHTLVVRTDWRNPAAQSREGFHRTWFNWGGLDGHVSMRAIGLSELLEPTVQTTLSPDSPQASQASVRVGVRVRNNGATRVIAPSGTLVGVAQTIPVQFAGRTIAHGQTTTMSTEVSVPEPALWSPSHPNLYTLSLAVGEESGYSARVGLRQLTWSAGRMFLNGQQLKLHGASIQADAPGHGDALTAGDEDKFIAELKAIGANAVRSQHPLDPTLLERLDAAGILVWQGIGPVEGASEWHSSTPALLREAEQQARTAALAAQLHPSIIAWNLVDEVAHNGHDAAEVDYVQALTSWLHEHDPTRMVAVDVWGDHPPIHAGSLYRGVDAVAETDYTGWYDFPRASPAQQRAMMRTRLAAQERTFAGKVLIISEFGAESNTLNPPGSPGTYAFQAQVIARHISVYAADPKLSGMLVWDLRDYPLVPTFEGGSIHSKLPKLRLIEGLNQKGLFTYSGAPKPAVSTVARLFNALPQD
jgi:Glycosyl hydrolases family 2, TIM barrel domain/Glycosyl hydrolases family 2